MAPLRPRGALSTRCDYLGSPTNLVRPIQQYLPSRSARLTYRPFPPGKESCGEVQVTLAPENRVGTAEMPSARSRETDAVGSAARSWIAQYRASWSSNERGAVGMAASWQELWQVSWADGCMAPLRKSSSCLIFITPLHRGAQYRTVCVRGAVLLHSNPGKSSRLRSTQWAPNKVTKAKSISTWWASGEGAQDWACWRKRVRGLQVMQAKGTGRFFIACSAPEGCQQA